MEEGVWRKEFGGRSLEEGGKRSVEESLDTIKSNLLPQSSFLLSPLPPLSSHIMV